MVLTPSVIFDDHFLHRLTIEIILERIVFIDILPFWLNRPVFLAGHDLE